MYYNVHKGGDNMAKVQITLDDKLLERIDAFADENYMSRSGLISMMSAQYLNSADVTRSIRDLSLAVQKIADTGSVDHETLEQIEDFQRAIRVLMPQK